jgi:transketolase
VRVRTIIGWPAPKKKDTSSAHGSPLGEDEIAATKALMGWDHPKFYVPSELRAATDEVLSRGNDAWQTWQAMRAGYASAHPDLSRDLDRVLAGKLPDDWEAALPSFPADAKGLATRVASGKVIEALGPKIAELVGGSADLAGSNNTYQKGAPDFQQVELTAAPKNVHWGIREHAMGSCINGLALHGGVVPYGATFLIFSDYMRPALRLAALMELPTRYVFTHDSIGLGEDGPTHQPVEQLASLRAIPGFTVLRPGDANEVRECWRVMLNRRGPCALVLTRQNLPTLDRDRLAPAEGTRRGGYVLSDREKARVILIATGSEVPLALDAQKVLDDEGLPARVVSMPSWEIFGEQDAGYRESVLPPSVRARVAIEAGVRFGWERWVGEHGGFVTLERFGASAPPAVLFEKFGFTPRAVAAEARRVVAS